MAAVPDLSPALLAFFDDFHLDGDKAMIISLTAEQFKGFVEHELKWLKESVSVLASEGKYRLQLGPFPSAPEARSIAERIATTLKLKPYLIQR